MLVPVAVAVAAVSGVWQDGGAGGGGRLLSAASEGRAGAGEGAVERGGAVGLYAEHVLVGGHAARHLDELHEEEHAHPGQLQARPDGEDERVGVGVDDPAEGGGEDVALV